MPKGKKHQILPLRHYFRQYPMLFYALLTVLLAATGMLTALRGGPEPEPHWTGQTETLTVVVESVPKRSPRSLSMEATVEMGSQPGTRMQLRLASRDTVDSLIRNLLPGDVLLLRTTLEPLRHGGNPGDADYASILRHRGIAGTAFCYANQWRKSGRTHLTFKTRLLRLRQRLVGQLEEHFEGRDLAVLAALTLGDKSLLDSEMREVFSETGTSHVLALSGLHLGILFAILNFLFVRWGRLNRTYLTVTSAICLLMLWVFVFIAGMPYSLVRAAIMYSLIQGFGLAWRVVYPLDALSLTAIVMLLIWPDAIFDIGFQLSFLSLLGISTLSQLFPRVPYFVSKRTPQHLKPYLRGAYFFLSAVWNLAIVSMTAILATAPIVGYTFHVVPVYGVLSSFVAIPLTWCLLILTFVFYVLPFAQGIIAAVIGFLMRFLFGALEWIADLPFASFRVYPTLTTVLLLYVLMLVTYSLIRHYTPLKTLAFVFLATIIVCGEYYDKHVRRLPPQLIFYQNYSAPALHLIENRTISYLWSTKPERADSALQRVKSNFWERERLTAPLVLRADTLTPTLSYTSHVVQFHDQRVALLSSRIAARPKQPLPVDYLFLVRGWNRPLPEALTLFRPDTIVLDASLSAFYRSRYHREADSLHIPLYDLNRQGALCVSCAQAEQ